MNAVAQVVGLRPAVQIEARLLKDMGRAYRFIGLNVFVVVFSEIVALRTDPDVPGLSPFELQIVLLLLGVGWAIGVWRGEGPDERQYFWSHPVDVSVHEAARVAAGAGWLLAGVATAVIASYAGASMRGVSFAVVPSALAWAALFTGPLLAYLLICILSTVTDRALEYLLLLYAAFWLIVLAMLWAGATEETFRAVLSIGNGEYGLKAALGVPGNDMGDMMAATPVPAPATLSVRRWLVASLVWYGVALSGLATAMIVRRGRLPSK